MEKLQLVNFIAKLMEDSGFKVYKDFKTSQRVIDIYAVLPSVMGDFSVVVACKNYDKQWEVGIDILKEMELVGRNLKSSKVAIVTSSNFSPQARNYASRKNIKLIDRDNLMVLAKRFSNKGSNSEGSNSTYSDSSVGSVDSYNDESRVSSYDDIYYDNSPYEGSPTGFDLTPSYQNYSSEDIYRDNVRYSPSNMGLGRYGAKSNISSSPRKNPGSNLNMAKKQGPSLSTRLKPYLNNPIPLIILVVAISFCISYILQIVAGTSKGVSGLTKILSALILSYGFVLFLNRDGTVVLVKGSIVFFVSLIILIMMIIFI